MVPHGQMTAQWQGKILSINYEGPLNVEAAILFSDKIKRQIAKRDIKNWQRLVTFSKCSLGGPDVCEITKHTHNWCFDNGCAACAIVVTSAPQRFMYGQLNTNSRFFRCEKKAYAWLSSQNSN